MKLFIKFIFFSMLFISTNSYSTEITPLLGFRAGGEFSVYCRHYVDSFVRP